MIIRKLIVTALFCVIVTSHPLSASEVVYTPHRTVLSTPTLVCDSWIVLTDISGAGILTDLTAPSYNSDYWALKLTVDGRVIDKEMDEKVFSYKMVRAQDATLKPLKYKNQLKVEYFQTGAVCSTNKQIYIEYINAV